MRNEPFVRALVIAALQEEKRSGCPVVGTVVQALHESNFGLSLLSRLGNNLFGVKRWWGWSGPILVMRTREVIDGKNIYYDAHWCKYNSISDCLQGRTHFICKNRRYWKCTQLMMQRQVADWRQFLSYLAEAGWATDPNYIKLMENLNEEFHIDKLVEEYRVKLYPQAVKAIERKVA